CRSTRSCTGTSGSGPSSARGGLLTAWSARARGAVAGHRREQPAPVALRDGVRHALRRRTLAVSSGRSAGTGSTAAATDERTPPSSGSCSPAAIPRAPPGGSLTLRFRGTWFSLFPVRGSGGPPGGAADCAGPLLAGQGRLSASAPRIASRPLTCERLRPPFGEEFAGQVGGLPVFARRRQEAAASNLGFR